MRELGKIIGYVVIVMVGGALLAPPLWWLGQWGIAQGIVPALRPFAFDKYLNRAALVLALGLLPWLVRSLRIGSLRALGIEPNPNRSRDLALGLGVAIAGFGAAVLGLVLGGALSLRPNTSVRAWSLSVLAAVVVAVVEELLFRGVFFGVLRRSLKPVQAWASLSLLFAALHFLRPNPSLPKIHAVTWDSGLLLLPHLLWEYAEPDRLWASFGTLTVMAGILGYTVLKTRSLYMAIGLHAGWVFCVKALSLTAVPESRTPFWLGNDWRSGAAPLALMLMTAAWVRLLLTDARRLRGGTQQKLRAS